LAELTTAFTALRRVDDELLALAVKNTNVKAYGLAYGPAASAVDAMNAALTRLVAVNASGPNARTIALLALGAEAKALHLETLLAPHVAESDDTTMDALEARMAEDDADVREDLDGLGALATIHADPDLAVAAARYAELGDRRKQILSLSRENTNVRSLAMSLTQKRSAMVTCQTALTALLRAIDAEPVPVVMPVRAVR
jgi:hypothetical protein